MDSKVNYTLIGLFVVSLTTALVAGVLWLGADIQAHEYRTYKVLMTESVSGLEENASVKYRGVDVGLVRDISLNANRPQQVNLLLDIESDIVVRQDDAARLETTGVTGQYYINITGGTLDSPPVRPARGAQYPVIESNPSFLGRVDATLSAMSTSLIKTANKVNDILSDANRQAFAHILENLDTATGSVAGRSRTMKTALDDLAASMRNTRIASERLPKILNRVEGSVTAIKTLTRQFSATAGSLDRTIANSGKDVERFTAQALPEAAAMSSSCARRWKI